MTLRELNRAVAVAAVLYVANAPPARGADRATNDWLRGAGEDLQICLRGEVLDSEGRAATDIQVTGKMNSVAANHPLKPTVDGNRFEIWIPVNKARWYSLWLRATSSHSDRVAYAKLNAYQLRQAAIDGIKFRLEPPSRYVEVKVVYDGRPVEGATVKAEAGFRSELRARSDADGICRFALLPDQELNGLTAWTDDRRIGGYQFDRKPIHDPNADHFEVELSKCRDQKLRFVDEQAAPVPGVDFVMQIATPPPDYNYIGINEHSYMKTDAAGEAVHQWFPDWKKHHFYADLDSDKWIVAGDSETEPDTIGGTVVVKLKKKRDRKYVSGRVTSTRADSGGFFVSLRSFQGEREHYSDVATTFTDPDGRFSVDVLPDATYCAYVLDSKWVGKIIDVIPFQSKPEKIAPVDLSVAEGQEVEVVVTSGPKKRPYPNLTVSFRRDHHFTWQEGGERHNGTGGPQWWATTDEAGRATTRTLPGKLIASVYTPLWRTQKGVDVGSGQVAKIELHREIEEKRKVTGRIALAEGNDANFDNAEIQIGSVDGNYEDRQTVKCNKDGSFSFETLAAQIGVFGRTEDGRFAGSKIIKNPDDPIDLRLRPTADFQGQLLGEGDRPLANHRVRAVIRVEGEQDFDAMFAKSFEAKRIESSTDERGNYTLVGIPTKMKVNIEADAADDSPDAESLDEVFLEPKEPRPRMVSRLERKAVKAGKVQLAQRYQAMLRDCRLSGYHLMLILAGDGENVTEFVDHNLVDYQTNKDAYSYMQLVVPERQNTLSSADAAFMKERNWQLPTAGRVVAYAIDANGKELGRLEIDVTESGAAAAAAEFIHQHAPAPVDAEKKWSEAFAAANQTHRRVWVRISQRYCGPCFRFTRWLDDQHELLEKDYVMLKIDDFHDLNGKVVAQRLTHGKNYGIPFHAIFDPGGEVLIDSAGPLGNIGSPSGFEGQKQLRKMLLQTKQNLTDADVEKLVESVGD